MRWENCWQACAHRGTGTTTPLLTPGIKLVLSWYSQTRTCVGCIPRRAYGSQAAASVQGHLEPCKICKITTATFSHIAGAQLLPGTCWGSLRNQHYVACLLGAIYIDTRNKKSLCNVTHLWMLLLQLRLAPFIYTVWQLFERGKLCLQHTKDSGQLPQVERTRRLFESGGLLRPQKALTAQRQLTCTAVLRDWGALCCWAGRSDAAHRSLDCPQDHMHIFHTSSVHRIRDSSFNVPLLLLCFC